LQSESEPAPRDFRFAGLAKLGFELFFYLALPIFKGREFSLHGGSPCFEIGPFFEIGFFDGHGGWLDCGSVQVDINRQCSVRTSGSGATEQDVSCISSARRLCGDELRRSGDLDSGSSSEHGARCLVASHDSNYASVANLAVFDAG
jgi:hypothetical protein